MLVFNVIAAEAAGGSGMFSKSIGADMLILHLRAINVEELYKLRSSTLSLMELLADAKIPSNFVELDGLVDAIDAALMAGRFKNCHSLPCSLRKEVV